MKTLNLLSRLTDQRGIATIIALFMMIMLTMIGIAAINISNDEITIAGNEAQEMASFYAAEAGLERATAAIQNQYDSTGAPPTVMPSGSEVINNTIFAYNTVDNGAPVVGVLKEGTMAGLNAMIKTFTITSVGVSRTDHKQVRIKQDFRAAAIPLFQFAAFYDGDLEMSPGTDMTIMGRIHANGNIHLQSTKVLDMDSYLTSAGNILHGPKWAGPVETGDILIKNTDGDYVSMKNGDGTFLSSADSNWYYEATHRWEGRVQDATFGHGRLNLAISNPADPHKVIERYNGGANPDSYEGKASAKIIDGRYYYNVAGIWQDVTGSLPAGTITTSVFFDKRENTNVTSTDIDMALLAASMYAPPNGVLYSSDQRPGTFNAVRLKNGSDIGAPLSIYCENPIYVQGNYNTVSKQPASLSADAVTFLSNSWNDANSSLALNQRGASATACNASIITGNTNTTATKYNGGLENILRFLEDWHPNRTFTFRGSIVNLWQSQQANSDFPDPSDPLYDAFVDPIRDWAYDTDLDNPALLPPETPKARVFYRVGWRMEDIALVNRMVADTTL